VRVEIRLHPHAVGVDHLDIVAAVFQFDLEHGVALILQHGRDLRDAHAVLRLRLVWSCALAPSAKRPDGRCDDAEKRMVRFMVFLLLPRQPTWPPMGPSAPSRLTPALTRLCQLAVRLPAVETGAMTRLALILSLIAAPALADRDDHDLARRALEAGEILPLRRSSPPPKRRARAG
jgi:hypothetical protein